MAKITISEDRLVAEVQLCKPEDARTSSTGKSLLLASETVKINDPVYGEVKVQINAYKKA